MVTMCVGEKSGNVNSTASGQQVNNYNGNSRNGLQASENTGLTTESPGREDPPGETKPDSNEGRMEIGEVPLEKSNKKKSLRAHLKTKGVWTALGFAIGCLFTVVIVLGVILRNESSSVPCPFCPPGWVGFDKKCYYFSQAESDWNSSQSNCTSFGASLAIIHTKQELDFIIHYLKPAYHWLGLQREANQPWRWVCGSQFNSTLFQIKAHGDCAYLNDDAVSSTWCDSLRNWICTKSLSTS